MSAPVRSNIPVNYSFTAETHIILKVIQNIVISQLTSNESLRHREYSLIGRVKRLHKFNIHTAGLCDEVKERKTCTEEQMERGCASENAWGIAADG